MRFGATRGLSVGAHRLLLITIVLNILDVGGTEMPVSITLALPFPHSSIGFTMLASNFPVEVLQLESPTVTKIPCFATRAAQWDRHWCSSVMITSDVARRNYAPWGNTIIRGTLIPTSNGSEVAVPSNLVLQVKLDKF